MIGLFFDSLFGNEWSVLWFNIWEWLVCSLIQYLGMTGLFFDSVFGKGTFPTLWEGYLPIIGLFFDSVFGKGTYPTLWEGYLPPDWSVLWFNTWEGYLPHPLGRVLTPPCVGTSTAFQSSVWYCYCPSYRAHWSCAEPDVSRHMMAIRHVYCCTPDRTAACASYNSAQKSASEAESDLHV